MKRWKTRETARPIPLVSDLEIGKLRKLGGKPNRTIYVIRPKLRQIDGGYLPSYTSKPIRMTKTDAHFRPSSLHQTLELPTPGSFHHIDLFYVLAILRECSFPAETVSKIWVAIVPNTNSRKAPKYIQKTRRTSQEVG